MHDQPQGFLLLFFILTALSSAANAAYFGAFSGESRGQRLGAAVLSLVSFGTLLHSGYSALALLVHGGTVAPLGASRGAALVAQGVTMLGSLAITALIARRALSAWWRR
ncbi:MAG: hypothetical protein HYY02_00855 [Chloroflexi bacterium]|nr:hypothetical protein [Chloroflexota bacterium]